MGILCFIALRLLTSSAAGNHGVGERTGVANDTVVANFDVVFEDYVRIDPAERTNPRGRGDFGLLRDDREVSD